MTQVYTVTGTVGEMKIIGGRDMLISFILALERGNKGQRSKVKPAGLKRV